MDLKYDLDIAFRRCGIGYIYSLNPLCHSEWKSKDLDYVTIGVPYKIQHRFQIFWRNAIKWLGPELEVYYIQHGLPMEGNITELETLYFIKKESASKILRNFYHILLTEPKD